MSTLAKPAWLGRGCHWSASLFVLAAAMLFGGVAGSWFTPDGEAGWLLRGVQWAVGASVMGFAVAMVGSLLFGRNPVRWGMGMPVLVYAAGVFMALVAGREGAFGLLYGTPLFLGLAIASGVLASFLIDGIFSRPEEV